MATETQESGGGSGAGTGVGGASSQGLSGVTGGSNSTSSAGAGTSFLNDTPILGPDSTLAEQIAANYAALQPLFSGLTSGGSGTQTTIVPARPTSTNWVPYLVLAAIVGGLWYWYKHGKKEG